jgi:ATP-binding cassette subfamily B protein
MLEASGLTYTYQGSGRGIVGIDLSLERGSFTVLAGRAGAGKTTLLRVLLGLLPREVGQIRWHGQLVSDPASFFLPPRCVYVAQAALLRLDRSCEAKVLRSLLKGDRSWPELLVCDDLSAALDVRAERALWDRVFVRCLVRRGSACLAVSNRRPALRRADQIVVLADGQLEAAGALAALLETCAEIRQIWQGNLGLKGDT